MTIRILFCTAAFFAAAPFAAAQAKAPRPACTDRAEFHQLDFWIGDWEVFNKDQKLSDTAVQRALKGCALEEIWSGARGNDGKGLSTYNERTKKWEYFWVSSSGATSHFAGELLGTEMRFAMDQVQPDGSIRQRHWSLILLPDGRVRELSVGSGDGGKTWTTEYDYEWRKKS
jgi:hypothetical protein